MAAAAFIAELRDRAGRTSNKKAPLSSLNWLDTSDLEVSRRDAPAPDAQGKPSFFSGNPDTLVQPLPMAQEEPAEGLQ